MFVMIIRGQGKVVVATLNELDTQITMTYEGNGSMD